MPLNKVQLNPGINREVTKYTNEAGWRDCDKVRFKQGYPEKIGGWQRFGLSSFRGVCRSLLQWVSLGAKKYIGVGTSAGFFVEHAGTYYDITPTDRTVAMGNQSSNPPNNFIETVEDEGRIVIFQANHGAVVGTRVTISGIENSTGVGAPTYRGITIAQLNTTHIITEILSEHKYVVVTAGTATSTGANFVIPTNGATIFTTFSVNPGPDFAIGLEGWSSQDYDDGTYGGDGVGVEELRVWNQAIYGEDLIMGPKGGEIYYWDTGSATFDDTAKTATNGVPVKNVLNGSPVDVSLTDTGATTNTSSIRITSVDASVGAKVRVGMSIIGTDSSNGASLFAANTTVVAVSNNKTVITLSANPIATTSSAGAAVVIFDNNPLSSIVNTTQIQVYDPTLIRSYEVGQHVTIAGCSGDIGGIPQANINGRHKIALVDEAANTFTTEAISGIDPATDTQAGGGGDVTVQYELSAEVPVVHELLLVSDASRFVFAFGCNAFGDATETKSPLLLRWSDQEDMFDWRPRSTNQAGDLLLSQGSEIVAVTQSRQEILVFTDSALYSLQYVGAPVVWGSQLVGSNMSIASSKAVAYVNGVAYWMGIGKFYKYDGTAQPMRCDVRTYIFEDLDETQYAQVFAGTLEEYHEVWWFYCSKDNVNSVAPDKYVVYNYMDDIWYYGTMDRSAWLDSPLNDFPLAATSVNNLVEHEKGNDDGKEANSQPINAYIESGQFGIESGTSFTFIDKIIPDVSFVGSNSGGPAVTMSLLGSSEPGAVNNDPLSEGGNSSGIVLSQDTVEQYTEQLDTRVRGRQLAIKVESTEVGVAWQLGTPRLNMRPDGRRGK